MSFVLLGILNSQAAGAGGAGAYDLLETTTLASSASSVSFTGLGSYTDYKHLQIRWVGRGDASVTFQDATMRVNSDSGSNYAQHYLRGTGSTVESDASTARTNFTVGNVPFGSSASNAFGVAVIDILDFSSTDKNTTFRILSGDTIANQIALRSGLYVSTSSITSTELFASTVSGRNWDTGTRFSLYGIKG